MIDRSESQLIAQERRNRGIPADPTASHHASDPRSRPVRKAPVSNPRAQGEASHPRHS